jgi:hypothetical protein
MCNLSPQHASIYHVRKGRNNVGELPSQKQRPGADSVTCECHWSVAVGESNDTLTEGRQAVQQACAHVGCHMTVRHTTLHYTFSYRHSAVLLQLCFPWILEVPGSNFGISTSYLNGVPQGLKIRAALHLNIHNYLLTYLLHGAGSFLIR